MEMLTLILILGLVAIVGMAAYFYVDLQARAMRTRLVHLPDGLRFEAHGFSLEVQRQQRQVVVHTRTGQWDCTPAGGGPAQTTIAPLQTTLPAIGLRIEVAPKAPKTGDISARPSSTLYTIVLHTTEVRPAEEAGPHTAEHSVVRIDNVPTLVARRFMDVASRMRVWIEKMERRQALDRVAQARQAKEAAERAEAERLLAEARKEIASDQPLTDADREAIAGKLIAKWREAAGFTGNATEVSTDAGGEILWFIDLANDGRITLHSDKRTIHATLMGASIQSQGGELEIGVRDDYWTEEQPSLRFFRLFKGMSFEARRAWQERLELVRDSLQRGTAVKS